MESIRKEVLEASIPFTDRVIVDGHGCSTGLIGMARSWHADVSQNGVECERDHMRLIHWLAHLLTQDDHAQSDEVIRQLDSAGFHAAYERDTHRVTLACEGQVFSRIITGREGMAWMNAHPHSEAH